MINTYTCVPNQTSSETVFSDLKTFFEDKWTWSKIETNYPDSESTDYNTLTFWIDDTTYFRIIFDPAKSRYWVGCGEYDSTKTPPYADYVSFVPMEFWNDEAMNWVLVRWGQRPGNDYIALFNRYRVQVEQMKSASEKKKLHSKNRQFHHDLKKLLSYALEG